MLSVDQLMADPRTWTFHRLTAQPMEVRPADSSESKLVTPRSLGLKYFHAVRPTFYKFAERPEALRDPRNPGFQPVAPTSVVAASVSRMTAILDDCAAATKMVHEWRPRDAADAAFLAAELPHWKSLTNQVGVDAAWFLQHGFGAGRTGRVLPNDFVEVVEFIARLYASRAAGPDSGPDPWDTNPGFPIFRGGWMGRLATHVLAGDDADPDVVAALGYTFCARVGLHAEAAWGFGLNGRSGPRYKDTPAYVHVGRHAFKAAYVGKGWAQRNRIVQMAAAGINRLLRAMYTAMKNAQMAIHEAWHAGVFDYGRFSSLPFQYAADFSGFDASASPEVQDLELAALVAAFKADPRIVKCLRLWRFSESRSLITPSWDYENAFMTILSYEGTTHSGLKPTSVMNTFLQICVSTWALVRQGYALKDFPWSEHIPHRLASAHFGDDLRLATARPLDFEQWTSDLAEIGFKAGLAAGDDFLARHRSASYPNVPIAARVVQQTFANEHARLGRKSIGLHYLGFIARSERCEFLPTVFLDAMWLALRQVAWIEQLLPRLPTRSIIGLRRFLLTDPDCQRRIAVALQSSVGEAWITAQERESEHSENARMIVEAAKMYGFTAGVDVAAMDKLVDSAAHAVAALPRSERIAWATQAFDIAMNGDRRGEYAWAAGLLERVRMSGAVSTMGESFTSAVVADDDV